MATKKPTAKQIAARKKFAQMAKDGTLAKMRKASTKKGLKAPAKKRTVTARKLCSQVIRREGLKVDGTLKKGYHYVNGKPVKAKPAPKKKAPAKRKPAAKKRSKFLGIF